MKRMKRALCIFLTLVMLLCMVPSAFAVSGGRWEQYGSQWAYKNADGSWAYNWQTIDGVRYYFGSDGWMKTGWQEVGGKWYYFYGDGSMAVNTTIDGCYLDSSGVWQEKQNNTGADHWVDYGGRWAYQYANGSWAYGWKTIDGVRYYFNSEGFMATGWQQIGSSWYYFSSAGTVCTGWQQIGGSWYWFDTKGVMATGWKTIDGVRYYFTSDGLMATGWQKISGNWYYFTSGGAAATGWQQIDGNWFWFASNGVMATGWKDIASKTYYFGSDGVMVAGRTVTIGGKNYSFRADGSLIIRPPVGMNSELNRENILTLLDQFDTDGAYIIRHSDESSLLSWFDGAKTIGEGIDHLDTAVHEQCHGFTHTPAGMRYNSVRGEYTDASEWIYIGNGKYIEVPFTDVFASFEMANTIPDSLKGYRFDTYVNGEIIMASNKYGVYGLLNEFTAYCWGVHNRMQMDPFLEDNGQYRRGSDDFVSYMEFRYYILHYLIYAKQHYRSVYNGIVNNESFRKAFSTIDNTFAPIAAEMYNGFFGERYNALKTEMQKTAYVEMARILHS